MKKLWTLWILILLALIATWTYFHFQARDIALPLAENARSISIEKPSGALTFEKIDGTWQIVDQKTPKFGKFLAALGNACSSKDNIKDINDPRGTDPLTVTVNGNDTWIFGRINRFNRSHFVIHGDTVYTCNEQIKPLLKMPVAYWLAPDA